MQSTNLLNSTHTDLSLFFNILNDNIFSDDRFIQLMTLVEKDPNKYIYACYSESSYLKQNIYIPIFHTLYLASKHHNVILNDTNDLWLLDTFPNNTYYIMSNNNQSIDNKLNIKIINNLSEIGAI